MAAEVLHRWEAKCDSCSRWVRWERLKTDVPNTREVTICRCEHCSRQK